MRLHVYLHQTIVFGRCFNNDGLHPHNALAFVVPL